MCGAFCFETDGYSKMTKNTAGYLSFGGLKLKQVF